MGNAATTPATTPAPTTAKPYETRKARSAKPEQSFTQSHNDWSQQIKEVYNTTPTVTRTVVLPPGVSLNDPRLAEGVVTKEVRTNLTGDEVFEGWPEEQPFEVDVDAELLPPCKGTAKVHAHYAVYPDNRFANLRCGYCTLHKAANEGLYPGNSRPADFNQPSKTLTEEEAKSAVRV